MQHTHSILDTRSVNCLSQYCSDTAITLYWMDIHVNAVHVKSILFYVYRVKKTLNCGEQDLLLDHNSSRCVWWHVLNDILVHSLSYTKWHLCCVSMDYRGWIQISFYTQWGIKYNCFVFSLMSRGPTWVRKHLMDGQYEHAAAV